MRQMVVALTISLAAVLGLSLPTFAQANVAFDAPTASGAFGEPITFETTFSSEEAPLRVELLASVGTDPERQVSLAAVEPIGPDRWQARIVQGGHVVPNTTYRYRFRFVGRDGDVLGPEASHRVDDDRYDWEKLAGDVVTVWWHRGDEAFARRALEIAEDAVASAATLLGVDEVAPVDFIIYSDSRGFRQAMGPATRENVGGQAHPSIRTLFGLIEPRQISSDWVEELVIHELSHLVFDEAVGNPYSYPPRWLNEGLAKFLSTGYTDGDLRQVLGAASAGTIIPLDGLGGQFPTRPGRFGLAYAESVSAVDHFVATYGQEQLVKLITSFADGIGLDAAFVAATGHDFKAFDDAWLASLGAERPEPYGPRPAPPGNVPDAWDSPTDALLR